MRYSLTVLLLSLCIAADATGADRVPAGLLEIPETVATVLIADAGSASLRRFANNGDELREVDASYMSIGRNGVGKQRAWDRRTPLGIYFITEELDTGRLHDKYGDKAFVLDYPNAWDRAREKTGDGIWLHGVDRRDPERPPRDTDGCLALPNQDIVDLVDDLEPLVTPVIVTRAMQWSSADDVKARRAELRNALARWQRSIETNDVYAYLALYADSFRFRGMPRSDWVAWRHAVFAERASPRLRLEDVLLLADPEEPDLYLSRFTQVAAGENGTVVTVKRLYWRRDAAGLLTIVSEDNG